MDTELTLYGRKKRNCNGNFAGASIRVQLMFPKYTWMLGGNQTFYKKIGYERKALIPLYQWELEVFIS